MQILDINASLDEYAEPGHWNDADMLVVGIIPNQSSAVYTDGAKGCTEEEYRSHMSLWCLMAAPLLAGNDIREMPSAIKNILLNREVIEVDQDILGKQAKKIRDDGDSEVFVKPLKDGSWAVGLLNRNDSIEKTIRISWKELGKNRKMKVRDLWEHRDLGFFPVYFEKVVKSHQCFMIRVYEE
jgi:alpha-galactosidase